MRKQQLDVGTLGLGVEQLVPALRDHHGIHDERPEREPRRGVGDRATIPALASMPVFVAATGMSVATASICAATMAGSSATHAVTATEFCAVIAVIAEVPWTRCAANVRRSA